MTIQLASNEGGTSSLISEDDESNRTLTLSFGSTIRSLPSKQCWTAPLQGGEIHRGLEVASRCSFLIVRAQTLHFPLSADGLDYGISCQSPDAQSSHYLLVERMEHIQRINSEKEGVAGPRKLKFYF